MPGGLTRLFMTTDAVGGVWTYALDLARGLGAHGVRTTLATLGPRASRAKRAAAAAVPGLRLIETGAALDWLAADEAAIAAAAAAAAVLAREDGAEIVHLNTPALAGLARFEAPVVGACHSCLATWWAAVRDGAPPADFAWRIDLLARGYRACDALVAPSAAFAEATRRAYGVRPLVVRNGGDARAPAVGARQLEVLTAGRLWDEGKNLVTLDRAAARLDVAVFAAGDLTGPAGGSIGLDNVVALGPLGPAALRDRMERAAIFASLAVYEPFGLAALEAAGAGCALVLSDIPSFRELWEGAALFVPTRDHVAVAAALQGLLNDPVRLAALAASARERATRYTVARMAADMQAVYRSLRREAAA